MNKITHNYNILNIEAGVTSGQIRKFNLNLKSKYCTWKMRFSWFRILDKWWTIFGCRFYCSKKGLYGSDMIRKINYIDSNGEYQSITKQSGEIFDAMRKMGGQYGIIVSIDVELINESKPITKYYAVKVTNSEVKTTINILCNNDDLNSKGICMTLFYNNNLGDLLIIVCQYNKKLFNKNPKLLIEKALDKNILPISFF